MEDFVPCRRLSVYLIEKNEGGSPKGFNFFVRTIEAGELERFVKETLDIFDIPNDGVDIFAHPDLPSKMMSNKNSIIRVIKKYKESLDKETKKSGK